MNMTIIMYMNIYITKENENYLRNLQGSMSGYINGLIELDKGDAKMVREHIVQEGRELGILKKSWPTIEKDQVIVAANSASPIKRGATPAKPPSPSTVQTKPLAHPWEPVDEDTTLKAVKELHRQQNNPRFSGAIASCKIHGIPLDARGRCMQKGCRYG